MERVNQSTRREVYKSCETSSKESGVDLDFLSNDALPMPLTGICSTSCNEGAIWSPEEPYELSRPSFDTEYRPIKRQIRKSQEPQNYVKALLQSDSELEMLSGKIRSQLRQSEMCELAVEAEKAALAGEDSFSGKPSVFGGAAQDNLVPVKLRRRQTFSEGIAAVRPPYMEKKLKVLALRDINEVIPNFRHLHVHMQTHMYRRHVDDNTLSFKEVIDSDENLHLQIASDLASQSMTFFENMTDISKVQLATQRMIDRSGACSPTFCDVMLDDDSQGSGTSCFGRFGNALASHLSPTQGQKMKRPPLVVPAGLCHPDEAAFSGNVNANEQAEMEHSLLSQHSHVRLTEAATPSAPTVDRSDMESQIRGSYNIVDSKPGATWQGTTSTTSEEKELDSDDESLELGISLAHRSAATNHVDVHGEGGPLCPPSPSEALSHFKATTPILTHETKHLTFTPRLGQPPKPEKHFSTPARLRRMREDQSPRAGENSEHENYGNGIMTPKTSKGIFEPSSIIEAQDTEVLDGKLSRAFPVRGDSDFYPALPSMKRPPKAKLPRRNRVFPESAEWSNFKKSKPQTAREGQILEVIPASQEGKDQFPGVGYSITSIHHENCQDIHSDLEGIVTSDAPSQEQFEGSFVPNEENSWSDRFEHRFLCTKQQQDQSNSIDERRQDDSSALTTSSFGEEVPGPLIPSKVSTLIGPEKMPLPHDGVRPSQGSSDSLCLSTNDKFRIRMRNETLCKEDQELQRCGIQNGYQREARTNKSADLKEIDGIGSSQPLVDERQVLESTSWELQKIPFPGDAEEMERAPAIPQLKKNMSWPRFPKCFVSERRNTGDRPIVSENMTRNAGIRGALGSLGFSLRRYDPKESKRNNGNLNTSEEGFQKAVGNILANLSPTSSQKLTRNYFNEAENNEFLSNYFYCVKPKADKKQVPKEEGENDVPIYRDALCSRIGIESMLCGLSGISFLFQTKDIDQQLPPKPAPVKARALSLGNEDFKHDDSWLGMLRKNSSRLNLSFNQYPDNSINGTPFRFQPPCLKMSSKVASSKLPSAEPIQAEREKGSTIQ